MRTADSGFRERFARIVSFLFNPMVVGVPVILLIGAGDVGKLIVHIAADVEDRDRT